MTEDRKILSALRLLSPVFCLLLSASAHAGEINTNELFDPQAIMINDALRAYIAEHPEAASQLPPDLAAGLTNQAAVKPVAAAAQSVANPNLPRAGDSVDIAFTSMDGKQIDVSAMKGKVVLVDYWATWCQPCRKGLTRLIITYNRYHRAGFEIVGISLDEDKAELEKAVHERAIPWPQAFDGRKWDSPLAKKYDIQSIPASILIGKDGKVAALDLRDNALEDKVAELLGAK